MSDYYSLIGVNRDATAGEIAIAYRQLVRQRHQELGGEANLGELSRAYRTISSIEKRREYDRTLLVMSGKHVLDDPANPTEAETSYMAGLEAMEKQKYQDAVACFARSAELAPEVSHFHSQLGLALGMFRDRLSEAEQRCKQAVELEPDNPELFYNLGFLYQRHNLNEAAQEAFSQAQTALAARVARFSSGLPEIIPVGSADGQTARTYSGSAAGRTAAIDPIDDPAAADLLKELESLESSFDGNESAAAVAPPEPPAAPGASADDLLKELESIEAEVTQVETGAQDPAVPEPEPVALTSAPEQDVTAPPEPEPVALSVEPAPPAETLSVDDLLRELAAMEEHVNQTEELHNGPAAEPEPAVADAFAPALPDDQDIFQETRPADDAALIADQADELLKDLGAEPAPLPLEPVQPAVDFAETVTVPPPALLAEPLPPEAPAEEAPLQLETAAIEQEQVPVLVREDEHGQPLEPDAQQKLQQLDALESEMIEELNKIKAEKKKLKSKKK
jgi:curved DNA-binding protein CbpA